MWKWTNMALSYPDMTYSTRRKCTFIVRCPSRPVCQAFLSQAMRVTVVPNKSLRQLVRVRQHLFRSESFCGRVKFFTTKDTKGTKVKGLITLCPSCLS